MDRLPPHSIDAEQGVLGCILISQKEAMSVMLARKVSEDWFYDLRHQAIYERLEEMFLAGEPLDLITVQQRLKDGSQLEAVGGLSYLSGLMDAVPSAANLAYYLDIIGEKRDLRVLATAATGILSDIHWKEELEPGEILDRAFMDLEKLRKPPALRSVRELVHICIDRMQDEFSGKASSGIALGWPRFDRSTGGLREGEMTIVGARTSTGKTSWLVSVLVELLKAGHRTGVATLEISDVAWMRKTISCLGRVDAMHTRELNEGQMKAIMSASARLAKMPLEVVHGRGMTLEEVSVFADRLSGEGGKVLMIDFIQKFRNTGKKNTVDWTSHCSAELSLIAQRSKLHLIVAAQLNRESDKEDRPLRLSDLKQSGNLEEDADMVILMHRTNEPECPVSEINLNLAKNRNGPVDGFIPFLFHKRQSRFEPASPIPPTNEPN